MQLAGMYFTGRVIDKLRASLPGGEPNGYLALSGFGEIWSHFTGVDLEELRDVVARAACEDDVEEWIRERTAGIDRIKVNGKLEFADTRRTPEHLRGLFESIYPATLRDEHPILFDLRNRRRATLRCLPSKTTTRLEVTSSSSEESIVRTTVLPSERSIASILSATQPRFWDLYEHTYRASCVVE